MCCSTHHGTEWRGAGAQLSDLGVQCDALRFDDGRAALEETAEATGPDGRNLQHREGRTAFRATANGPLRALAPQLLRSLCVGCSHTEDRCNSITPCMIYISSIGS